MEVSGLIFADYAAANDGNKFTLVGAGFNNSSGATRTSTGYSENLDLQETAASTVKTLATLGVG